MNTLLFKHFLLGSFMIFLLNISISSNTYSAAASDPVRDVELELKKLEISNFVSPQLALAPPKFEVSLERHVDGPTSQGKKVAARYFSKTASLRCGGITITGPEAKENFGEEAAAHLEDVGHFLEVYKNWHSNHLTASLFAVVNDKREDKIRQIEGSLLVERIEGEHKAEEIPSASYDFSVLPGNKGISKSKRKVNFSSQEVPAETPFSKLIDERGYLSVSKGQLRPITPTNNHGDQLALDTVTTNIDLFFSLIRKTAHRHDLPIIGMGMRYYSSYDGCDDCFRKIYDASRGPMVRTTGIVDNDILFSLLQ